MADLLPSSACPTCGTVMDDATGVATAARPGPGDVGICFYCAQILEYDDLLRVRLHPDRDRLATDPTISQIRAEIVAFEREGGR